MAKRTEFSTQQVADAIRTGLPNRPDVVLAQTEASELAVISRESLSHYREHVQESIAVGDYRQAAEKSWGAFTQTIKSIAADHGYRVRSHTNIMRVSEKLTALVLATDPETGAILDEGTNSAHSMHIHFYENDLPDETVVRRANSTSTIIDLLQELFAPEDAAS
ncbi:MAG: hypothetical protein F4X64_11635 [Chloroflexi bacterium]|nr:hypothetical protein [Chloroflexota bacterium]